MHPLKQVLSLLLLFSLVSSCSFKTINATTSTDNSGRISKEDQLRNDIVLYAEQYIGAPYLYASRDPRKGFDCSGFTYFVMKNFDIPLTPSSRAQENEGRAIKINEVKPGDLIFFRRKKNGRVFHVSLVYANDPDGIKVIHSTNRGVVLDNITQNSYWGPKISSARNVVSR